MRMLYRQRMHTFEQVRNNILVFLVKSKPNRRSNLSNHIHWRIDIESFRKSEEKKTKNETKNVMPFVQLNAYLNDWHTYIFIWACYRTSILSSKHCGSTRHNALHDVTELFFFFFSLLTVHSLRYVLSKHISNHKVCSFFSFCFIFYKFVEIFFSFLGRGLALFCLDWRLKNLSIGFCVNSLDVRYV